MSLLEVRDLTVGVGADGPCLLRDVSLDLQAGEILGLLGESGSGKTMLALALAGLLPWEVRLRRGTVRLNERQLQVRDGQVQRTARDISLIFQDPRAALNPTMRIGRQVARVVAVHLQVPGRAAWRRALELLRHVQIPDPERVAVAYPHQLSGGMCQRVVIAMAIACSPQVLVADEPTTALDVTVQAQILRLIRRLVAETGCAVLLITHDLRVVAEVCDRVAVIYGGQLMEVGPVVEVFEAPLHPYTRYLLDAARTSVLPAAVDAGVDLSLPGCRFAHRCPHVSPQCATAPPLVVVTSDRRSSCWLYLREAQQLAASP